MESALEFLTLGAESDENHWQDEYWEELEEISMTLRRLTRRRKSELRAGVFWVGAPEAWSVATYKEAILYRVVATAQGTIISWNAGNVLCSFLAARAFYETFAVLWKFDHTLARAVDKGDLVAIRNTTRKFIHATRDEKVLSSYPEFRATNIQTFIDHLNEKFTLPREAYDFMSEKCHPNARGTFQMFAAIDLDTKMIAYSDRKNASEAFFFVFAIIGLVRAAEIIIDKLDKRIDEIAALER